MCSSHNKQYYDILGIDIYSNIDTIKKAYRKLSLLYHPDKFNTETSDKFNNITVAYNNLIKDPPNPIPNPITDEIKNSSINLYSPPIKNPNNEDIVIHLEVAFEDSYHGANLPINIKRTILNHGILKHEDEKIYVPLPKSIDNNEIIIINNKGNCIDFIYSDVKIIIKLKDHEYFVRDGLNLIYTANITFKQSLVGIDFRIAHINNKTYRINNTNREVIHSNTNIIIREIGFQRDTFFGNLIIQFKIDYPKTLSLDTIEILNNIL
jgi:DnaJ family protein B protein 4